jgi:hypothetical protein
VTVFVVAALLGAELLDPALLDAALDGAVAAALEEALDGDPSPVVLTAAGTPVAVLPCVLKPSSITNPVTVLNSASATRRMRCP